MSINLTVRSVGIPKTGPVTPSDSLAINGSATDHRNGSSPTVNTSALAILLSRASISPLARTKIEPGADTKEAAGSKNKTIGSQQIKFTPYTHPTPGQSEVCIRGKGKDSKILIPYDPKTIPDPKQIPRSEIKINGLNNDYIKQARRVSDAILEEWKAAYGLRAEYATVRDAYTEELKGSFKYKVKDAGDEGQEQKRIKVRYKSTEAKTALRGEMSAAKRKCEEHPFGRLYGKHTSTTMEVFNGVYEQKANELIALDKVDLKDDPAFKTLVAYLCLRKEKEAGLSMLPHGLLNHDDEHLVEKVRVLGTYLFVNKLGLDTAEKFERFKNWTNAFNEGDLPQVGKLISNVELLKLMLPGYLDGENPPVREWLVSATNKWRGDDSELLAIKRNAERACKHVISAQEGIVKEDGTIDVEKFAEKDWGKIFHEEKYGLRGAIGPCIYIPGVIGAINLAIPGMIGGKNGLPRAKFKYPDKWDEGSRLEIIDELTRYIVERKLKLTDEHGKATAEKIKQVTNWHEQFDEECAGCLRRSGVMTAEAALKRVYPHLFGWRTETDQVNPGDIRSSGMWDSEAGEKLFKLKFAKSLHTVFEKLKEAGIEGFENHGVKFYPNIEYPLRLPRKDFISLKNYYIAHGISWQEHFLVFNLAGGFAEVCKSTERAFELTLGKKNKRTNCFGTTDILVADVIDKNPIRNSLLIDLLKDFPPHLKGADIKINNSEKSLRRPDYTGVEDTCLEPLLAHRPQSIVLEKTEALYNAFAAAVLPCQKKDKETQVKDNFTALEKILSAVYPTGDRKNDLILSDRRLVHLLTAIRDNIIDETNIDGELKARLKDLITRICSVKKPSNTPREVLLAACQTDIRYGERFNALGTLNKVIEHVFELMAIHEMRYLRENDSNTSHFQRVLGSLEIVEGSKELEEDVVEEVTDEEVTEQAEEADPIRPPDEDDELPDVDLGIVTEQTKRIAEGREEEEETIIRTLVEIAQNKTSGRRPLTELFKLIYSGEMPVQLRILYQLHERSRKRSLNKFDYASLRAKTLPTTNITSIVNPEDGSVATQLIDKELLSCIPKWWPTNRGEPIAVPLLYYNSTLYVGIHESSSDKLGQTLIGSAKDCEVKLIQIKEPSWSVLVEFFRRNHRYKAEVKGKEAIKQFIQKAEEDRAIENLAALRKAVPEYKKETLQKTFQS